MTNAKKHWKPATNLGSTQASDIKQAHPEPLALDSTQYQNNQSGSQHNIKLNIVE
jgi:hypothetical protein